MLVNRPGSMLFTVKLEVTTLEAAGVERWMYQTLAWFSRPVLNHVADS